jgi:catechol 2,3-dioxygenase-like lactoylglutathione lyase family enzyme
MRLQLALNVTDLDEAIDFYSKMFDTAPAKVKPGYANFAIAQPPLKLVLFEVGGEHPEAADASTGGFHHLNHLGVEVDDAAEVIAAEARISDAGIETTGVDDAVCCFAEKTETWMASPDAARWEWYVKNADADQLEHATVGATAPAGTCCAT